MLRQLLLATTLPALLVACDPAPTAHGGLDRNGDGLLDPADVDDGEIAIYLTRLSAPDAEGAVEEKDTAERSQQVVLEASSALAYSLKVDLADGMQVSLRFESEDLEGEAPVTHASATSVDSDLYAFNGNPQSNVTLTSDDTEVSGSFEGPLDLEVLGAMEEPTGELVRVNSFAFKALPIPAQ